MIEIVIEGLNMNAVNSLIWSSAILAKLSVIIIGCYELITVGTILIGVVSGLWD